MTLLSGTLLSVPVLERFPQSGQDALDTVVAECARDVPCHRAFPHLGSDWSALWSALQKAPIVVPAGISPSHQAVSFSADSVASGLHQLMAEPNTEAAIPLVIHTLGAAQDRGAAMVALAGALAKAGIVLSPGGSQEMIKYPIQCYEPWARDQASALVDKSSFEYHLDLVTARWWQYVCTLIPQSAQAAQYGAQTSSQVPVLALNGLADPQDPAANMDGRAGSGRTASNWPCRARHTTLTGRPGNRVPARSSGPSSSVPPWRTSTRVVYQRATANRSR